MPGTYGRTVLSGGGASQIMTLANLEDASFKPGGVTIDWSTVTAAASGTTYPDGILVASGAKGIRYGTVLARITASGKFGPYASGAGDGRQTLARGDCYVLNESLLESTVGSDIPTAVFDGGLVWKDRLNLAGGPTQANFDAAFPNITYATD